jgi:hypothetical protein
VLRRKALAAETLERARALLVDARKPVFESAIAEADDLLAKLNGAMPAAMDKIFRTP